MRISIVIPAYNEEESLASTIESGLNQNYTNFEVVVVDNASTDKTSGVANKFPIKLLYESKKGLLHARERGRIEATGDIIANMDADCLPDQNWLSSGIKLFEDTNVVAVTGPYDYYDASPIFRFFSLYTQKYIYYLTNKILIATGKGAVLIGGNNFIRANTLRDIGGYNTSILFYGEDTDTAKRVSSKGKVIFSPSLTMKTSARRFKAEGFFKISYLYLFHFFRVVFSGRV